MKKKISNRIDVERPEEDILLRYRENAHEPLTNYAEDHILNTVRNFPLKLLEIAQSFGKAGVTSGSVLFLFLRQPDLHWI